METIVLKNNEEIGDAVSNQIKDLLINKPNALLCLCGGHSPLPIFAKLVTDAGEGLYPSDSFKFVSLDEWVGLGRDDTGSCFHDIYKHFLAPLNVPNGDRVFFFDALSDNLLDECTGADEFINSNGGIDLMLLGIGVNGHIGFNEPGTSVTDGIRVLELSDKSKEVGQKYFNGAMSPDKGITLGLSQIMDAKKVIVIAHGAHKREIVNKTVHDAIGSDCPSTFLRNHTNCQLFVDTEAGLDL